MAVIVALLGMCKVFLLDMFQLKGMPLVLGVFSFSLVAVVGSIVSGRWQAGRARK